MPPLPISLRLGAIVAPEPLVRTPTNVRRMERKTKAVAKAKTWSAAPTRKREDAHAVRNAGLPRPSQVIQSRDDGSALAAQPSVLEE
eukprot:9222250-Pyramimonas_sp.AAC.1